MLLSPAKGKVLTLQSYIYICSDAIQGQETDSRHILLYSFILPIQFWIAGAQETKNQLFQTSLFKLTKAVSSVAMPGRGGRVRT